MDCSLVCNLFFSLNTFRNLNLNSANLNFYHFIGLISFYAFYYYFDLHKVHLSSTKSTFMKSGVYIFLKFKKNILGIMKLFSYFQQNFIDVCVLCICMNLYSVAVLWLDSHPDNNKGPDHEPCACPKTHTIDH